MRVARRFGSVTLPIFRLGETQVLENTFRESGLLNVTVQAVSLSRHYSSSAETVQRLKETALLRGPIEKLDEPARGQAWAEN